MKQSFADGAAAIKAKGDKGLSDLMVDPFANQQVRVSDMAWGLLEHSGEHYGQLVGYYRMRGIGAAGVETEEVVLLVTCWFEN